MFQRLPFLLALQIEHEANHCKSAVLCLLKHPYSRPWTFLMYRTMAMMSASACRGGEGRTGRTGLRSVCDPSRESVWLSSTADDPNHRVRLWHTPRRDGERCKQHVWHWRERWSHTQNEENETKKMILIGKICSSLLPWTTIFMIRISSSDSLWLFHTSVSHHIWVRVHVFGTHGYWYRYGYWTWK